MNFQNKIALVTGSGRGIGRSLALHFAQQEDASIIDQAISATPAGRLVTPEEVAGVVAFLCSPAAEMIRGQTITVDGGMNLPLKGSLEAYARTP